MKANEARGIKSAHEKGECDCFEGECMDQAIGFLDATKKAEPVVEELEKMRKALAFVDVLQDASMESAFIRREYRQRLVSSSAEVLATYKKECLGE